ncbi:hypothetical protein [Mesorhizobium sp. SEMIA 3007]|uniref:hypothetical protein n=1 Tax=Mesorhizobium sp. SEMIA 3007 TaxID=1862350 RepID=UPI00114CB246|nr:hypothetical protein [Mesorhizobium sp. SEMIA 3007]
MFSRLWERLGIAKVLGDLLKIRGFEFAVERAVFVRVLHRLFVSDLCAAKGYSVEWAICCATWTSCSRP